MDAKFIIERKISSFVRHAFSKERQPHDQGRQVPQQLQMKLKTSLVEIVNTTREAKTPRSFPDFPGIGHQSDLLRK